jgi:hypothetical protein
MSANRLKIFKNSKGSLFSFQKKSLNSIKRIFFIKGSKGAKRGNHAHLKASQLFINIDSKVFVETIHKNKKKIIFLSKAGEYFYCPPLSWVKLIFKKKGNLAVISNRIYEKRDYINNYNKFLKL